MRFARSVAVLLMALAMTVAVPGAVGAQEDSPWITVDKVMVNKLGGVNVQGSMSCSALYDQLLNGGVTGWYEPAPGQYSQKTIYADADDFVLVLANPDNYVVSQPAGRKTTIQVKHESSRAHPCFSNVPPELLDFTPKCDPSGAPCSWTTDRFGYFGSDPLFDYAATGQFKTGVLNVDVLLAWGYVQVYTVDNGHVISSEEVAVQGQTANQVVVRAVRS